MDPGEQGLLDQHDPEAGFARAGHSEDRAVGRQVARLDDEPVGARLARGVEAEPDVEVRHRPESKPVTVTRGDSHRAVRELAASRVVLRPTRSYLAA